jgi:glyoxylase-like metal-dependent hydrolase (beta-lactamase superfamily II)
MEEPPPRGHRIIKEHDEMKTSAMLASAFLIAAITGPVPAQEGKAIPVTKKTVTPNIVLYKTGRTDASSNMVAVRTSKGVVVVDALQYAAAAKNVREMIEKDFGAPVACLINSHGAYDHTAGNEVFADVPIYGHKSVKDEIERMIAIGKTDRFRQMTEGEAAKAAQLKPSYPGDPREVDEAGELTRDIAAAYQNGSIKAVVPTTSFDDHYTLDIGGRTFDMFHNTPSYSGSDIIIAVPEERAVIVGDVFNKNRLPLFGPRTSLESWEKLFSPYIGEGSGMKYFIGTHGDVMTIDEVREQMNYLRKLVDDLRRIKAEEKSSTEAKKELALEIFPYLTKFNPYFYGTTNHIHERNIDNVWNQLSISPAEARKIIAEGNRAWGRARVAYDRPTFERMLAPDFFVLMRDRKLTRREFIEGISNSGLGAKLTRFDASVLTVQSSADGWTAVICEKLEYDTPQGKAYSLWITRDGWKQIKNQWVITSSEAIGSENWIGAKPPFPDWSSPEPAAS